MNDDPWDVLGQERSQATPATAKQAYAMLLRRHRPDKDPEGFKLVRAAYEAAIEALANPSAPDSVPCPEPQLLPVPSEPLVRIEVPGLTPPILAAEVALKEAIASRARQKIRIAWTNLDEAAASLMLQQRHQLAMQAFGDESTLLADCVSDDRLLMMIESSDTSLALRVLDVWADAHDARRLNDFSVSLNRARKLHNLEACAVVMVRTAIVLAPWDSATAERLSAKAFPVLSGTLREQLMVESDHAVLLGKLVAPFPSDEKVFWLACLRGKPSSLVWDDTEGRRLLINLVNLCGLQWPGFGILQNVLTAGQWANLKAAIESML